MPTIALAPSMDSVVHFNHVQERRNVGRAGGGRKKLRAMQTYEKQKIVANYQARN